jgi:uncharacterized protein (TIGR00725 family)
MVASQRVFKYALLGSASLSEDSREGRRAYRIGRLVAEKGGVLLTGGCPGVPHAGVLGARSAGGLTVAISPAANREEHGEVYAYPLDSEVIVFTGMGTKGRNVVLVRSADACIFAAGSMGTLNEFTIAFDELGEERAIGILGHANGLTAEFARLVSLADRPSRATIVEEADPDLLVDMLFTHVRRQ